MTSTYEEDSDDYTSYFSDTSSVTDNTNSSDDWISSQCSNTESVVTLMPYEESDMDELFTVKIQNRQGKFEKGTCLTRSELMEALKADRRLPAGDPPDFVMSIYTKPTFERHYRTGLTGKPTLKIVVRLPSNNIYVTIGSVKRILEESNNDWYAVLLFGGKRRRLGNIHGHYGASMNHGQVPGFQVYKLYTKEEIKSGVEVRETLEDYLLDERPLDMKIPLDKVVKFKNDLFDKLNVPQEITHNDYDYNDEQDYSRSDEDTSNENAFHTKKITDLAHYNGNIYTCSHDGTIKKYNMNLEVVDTYNINKKMNRLVVAEGLAICVTSEHVYVYDLAQRRITKSYDYTHTHIGQIQYINGHLFIQSWYQTKLFIIKDDNVKTINDASYFAVNKDYLVVRFGHPKYKLKIYKFDGHSYTLHKKRRLSAKYGVTQLLSNQSNTSKIMIASQPNDDRLIIYYLDINTMKMETISQLPRYFIVNFINDEVVFYLNHDNSEIEAITFNDNITHKVLASDAEEYMLINNGSRYNIIYLDRYKLKSKVVNFE